MGYSTRDIKVYKGMDAIRCRVPLYIGPIEDPTVFNRLIQESLCIGVDEAFTGHCTRIHVEVGDGNVLVRDNGRGLPATPDKSGLTDAEILLTFIGGCRAYKNGRASDACCGVGLVVVNALSERLRIRNFREGICWTQYYERGVPLGPFKGEPCPGETGIELSFSLERALLGPLSFDAAALLAWFSGLGLSSKPTVIPAQAGGVTVIDFEQIVPPPDADADGK